MSNKTRLQTNNTNLQSLIDKANSLPDAGSSGELPLQIVNQSGIVSSTAAGNVIYSVATLSGGIDIREATLVYQSPPGRYRHALDEGLLLNTPIIVLTSGTITMPSLSEYSLRTIVSGSGYKIYKYVMESDDPIEEEIPF